MQKISIYLSIYLLYLLEEIKHFTKCYYCTIVTIHQIYSL